MDVANAFCCPERTDSVSAVVLCTLLGYRPNSSYLHLTWTRQASGHVWLALGSAGCTRPPPIAAWLPQMSGDSFVGPPFVPPTCSQSHPCMPTRRGGPQGPGFALLAAHKYVHVVLPPVDSPALQASPKGGGFLGFRSRPASDASGPAGETRACTRESCPHRAVRCSSLRVGTVHLIEHSML